MHSTNMHAIHLTGIKSAHHAKTQLRAPTTKMKNKLNHIPDPNSTSLIQPRRLEYIPRFSFISSLQYGMSCFCCPKTHRGRRLTPDERPQHRRHPQMLPLTHVHGGPSLVVLGRLVRPDQQQVVAHVLPSDVGGVVQCCHAFPLKEPRRAQVGRGVVWYGRPGAWRSSKKTVTVGLNNFRNWGK